MKTIACLLTVFTVFTGCIGWNSEQKEVVNSYNEIRQHVEEGNWNRLVSSCTENTGYFLETLAVLYTESGAPFENDPERFVEALAQDTDILVFPGTILSVEIMHDRAVLTADNSGKSFSYEFRRESGRWKLHFEPVLFDLFQELMEGIPGDALSGEAVEAVPSIISIGNGPCAFVVRNGLHGLAIHGVFLSPGPEEDLLGPNILGTGSELRLHLEPGTYDIQVYDSRKSSYTLRQVELDENGVLWETTETNLDI